jgi:hypothetical protein
MPIIPFAGAQTIATTGTAQPVFGTKMNGAGQLAPDPFSGKTGPGSNPSQSILPVASIVGFAKNHRVLVGPIGGPYDQGSIFALNAVGPTMTVQGLQKAHASGEVVILNEDVSQVTIIPVAGNAGSLYVGNASTVSATDSSLFDIMGPETNPGQPTYWHNPPSLGAGGGYKTSEYWIEGTAGDKFMARYSVL